MSITFRNALKYRRNKAENMNHHAPPLSCQITLSFHLAIITVFLHERVFFNWFLLFQFKFKNTMEEVIFGILNFGFGTEFSFRYLVNKNQYASFSLCIWPLCDGSETKSRLSRKGDRMSHDPLSSPSRTHTRMHVYAHLHTHAFSFSLIYTYTMDPHSLKVWVRLQDPVCRGTLFCF